MNDVAKADLDITVTDEFDPADVAVIVDGLGAYDFSRIGYRDFRRLAVLVRNPQTGKVVGGRFCSECERPTEAAQATKGFFGKCQNRNSLKFR